MCNSFHQEILGGGPFLFMITGECIDAEDGCMQWHMPPDLVIKSNGEKVPDDKIECAWNLTWVNREWCKMRTKVFMGFNMPVRKDPSYYVDGWVEDRTVIDMLRMTSTITMPGGSFTFQNVRKHTGHDTSMHMSTSTAKK